MRLAIIIPAHNEEQRIGHTLKEYSDFFEGITEKFFEYELLVVINNTKDKTKKIVEEISRENSKIKFIEFSHGGKGFAVTQGFKWSLVGNNDFIGFVDADMSTRPEHFYELIQNIGSYDGIIASRYIPGAKVFPKQEIKRIIASRVFNFLVRIFFLIKIRDTQCGAKIFKREVLEKIVSQVGETEWAFDVELIYRILSVGGRIKEYPAMWEDRDGSKVDLKSVSTQMFFSIIKLRLLNSSLKPQLNRTKNKLKGFRQSK